MDLSGRPTVASASEAQKNTKDNVLDVDKHKGKAGTYKGPSTGPAGGVFKPNKGGTKIKEKPSETEEEAAARKRSAEILAEVMAEQEAEEAARRAAEESAAIQEGAEVDEPEPEAEAEPEPEPAAEEPAAGGDGDEYVHDVLSCVQSRPAHAVLSGLQALG